MTTCTSLMQHSIGSPSHSSQTRRNKGIQIGEEEVELSQFAINMILYIENPIVSFKRPLDIINESGEVARYKILQNLWHFHTPIMNYQKEKLKQSVLLLQQKDKVPRNKFNQGCKRPVLGKL